MSANKECELPAADSCGLAEGEEPEDDMVYSQKPTLLGKLRAIANKVCIWYFFKADCALHVVFHFAFAFTHIQYHTQKLLHCKKKRKKVNVY